MLRILLPLLLLAVLLAGIVWYTYLHSPVRRAKQRLELRKVEDQIFEEEQKHYEKVMRNNQ